MRLYDYSGSIRIGGYELRDLDKFNVRSQIALLDPDCILFSGSIYDNVRLGLHSREVAPHEYRARCERALADAGADFVAELPGGMDTRIDNTSQFSGGQKQRICLARALIAEPAMLIFDEPTSALDARSEAKVMEAIQHAVKRGITVLMVAHRLSTVLNANQIVVMAEGRAVEQAKLTDLAAEDTLFSQLLAAQSTTLSMDQQPGADTIPTKKCGSELSFALSLSSSSPSSSSSYQKATLRPEVEVNSATAAAAPTLCQDLIWLFQTTRCDRLIVAVGVLAAIMSGGLIVGEAIIFGHLVQLLNTGQESQDFSARADFFCLMFFVLACVAFLSYVGSGTAFGIASSRFVVRIQSLLLEKALRMDMTWFAKEGYTAIELASRLSKDSSDIACLSGVALGIVCSVTVSMCGGIVLAHVVAWKIALVLLSTVTLMIACGFVRMRLLAKADQRHRRTYGSATSFAIEACQSRRVVTALGVEDLNLEKFDEALRKPYKEGRLPTICCNLLLALSLSITYFVYAPAYWWGAKQVRNGTYTQEQFFIVLPALLFSAQSAGQLFSLSPEVARARSAAASILQMLSDESTTLSGGNQKDDSGNLEKDLSLSSSSESEQPPKLQFKSVTFAYTGDARSPVLRDVSFDVQEGKTTALVGPSGAGNSSIIALMERFYHPSDGAIFFEGIDLRDLDVTTLRSRTSLVAQDSDLLPGSIEYNIRLGATDRSLSHADIESVAKQSGLHSFVTSLPHGYGTQRGTSSDLQLSGGQRQRVALARALIRNPEVLLLDEPTATLDAHSERHVQDALGVAAEGRTTVIVAHRLATVRNADKIIVLDAGRVVEQGTHNELVASGGLYAAMARTQALA